MTCYEMTWHSITRHANKLWQVRSPIPPEHRMNHIFHRRIWVPAPRRWLNFGQFKHHASDWGHIPSLLRWSVVIRTDSTISIMVTAVLRRHHCLLGWVSFLRGRRHLGISACFIAEGIPWPLGPMAWPHGRGPHGPGQLRPNFRCLFIRKERCGRHMPSFIPTRRLLYVSRINYTSYTLA